MASPGDSTRTGKAGDIEIMWGYYSAVILVGIGFLTIGIGWSVLALASLASVFFGIRHRARTMVWMESAIAQVGAAWPFALGKPAFPAKVGGVQEAPHRWLFAEPKMIDIRREGFDALSEMILLFKRLVPFYSAALFEYDADTHFAYPRVYSAGSEGFRKDAILSVSDGVVGYCLSSGKVVHYPDFNGDARLLGYYSTQEDIRSVVAIPLDRASRRIGALILDAKVPDAFSARLEDVRQMAQILSELLIRVQREETLILRLEEDRTLKAMTERMAKAGVSIEDVADSLCGLSREVFPADRVTFVVFDEPSSPSFGKLAVGAPTEGRSPSPIVRFRSLKMIDRYVELVARTKKTLRLDDLWENGMLSLATGQSGIATRSLLAAPFVFDAQVLGVVLLESDRRRAFNAFHETAVGELVLHAGTAVARAIEYGRMEKMCAIADVVPMSADRIFGDPSMDPISDLLKSRFNVSIQIFEIVTEKTGESLLRPWDRPESHPVAPVPFFKKVMDAGSPMIRTYGGAVVPVRDVSGEAPAGSDLVFPLSPAAHPGRPFGLFHLILKSPLRAETLQILERVKSLIQIRLILELRERRFAFLKERDPLTGIFHSATFEKKLDDRVRLALADGQGFSLIVVQAARMSEIRRSHGFAESSRRFTALCSEVERICGPRFAVGRVGPADIGVIWEGGEEGLRAVKSQIERLSASLGFQVRAGSAAFPNNSPKDAPSRESLLESAAAVRIVSDVPA